MPFYSIIVPVYNSENYIYRCLYSISRQSFSDFEVIVIDDGSSDNSFNICKSFSESDSRFKVFHKKNEGVSITRNYGVSLSTGEFLCFVDSDDYVDERYLESFYLGKNADIVKIGIKVENSKHHIKKIYPIEDKGLHLKKDIEKKIFPYLIHNRDCEYYSPSLAVHAFKKNLFLKNMLKNVKVSIGEDGACVIPCIFNANSLFVVKDCLYNYCYNDSSATKSHKIYDFEDVVKIYNHLFSHIDLSLFDFSQQINRKIVHDCFFIAKSKFYEKKKYFAIKKEIISFIRKNNLICNALYSARFRGLKARLMHYSLKFNMIFLIKVLSLL